jgi:hypothetical protein
MRIVVMFMIFVSLRAVCQDRPVISIPANEQWDFNNIPLSKVFAAWASYYNLTILNPDGLDIPVMMQGFKSEPIEALLRSLALCRIYEFSRVGDTVIIKRVFNRSTSPKWTFTDQPLSEIIQQICNAYDYSVSFIYMPPGRASISGFLDQSIDDFFRKIKKLAGVRFQHASKWDTREIIVTKR